MTCELVDVCLTRGLYYHAAVTKGWHGDACSHGIKGDTRRAMGWVALAGGMLVLLFWILYFTGGINFGQDDRLLSGRYTSLDATADGNRFLALKPIERPEALPLLVWFNWVEEFAAR